MEQEKKFCQTQSLKIFRESTIRKEAWEDSSVLHIGPGPLVKLSGLQPGHPASVNNLRKGPRIQAEEPCFVRVNILNTS